MKYRYAIMLGASLVSLNALAMEDSSEWRCINRSNDVIHFVGEVIAFKTTSTYFARKGSQYTLSEDSTFYGYISSDVHSWEEGQGYNLATCLYKNSTYSMNGLVDSTLKDASMQMRNASAAEKEELLQALNADKVEFDYDRFNKGEILKALASKE